MARKRATENIFCIKGRMVVLFPNGIKRVMELCVLWAAYAGIGAVRIIGVNFGCNIYGNGIQKSQPCGILPGMAIYCLVDFCVLFKWGYRVYELKL